MNLQDLEMYHNLTSDNVIEKKYYLIYCRKSEESEDRQIQSIADQIKILTELAGAKDLQIEQVFTENKSAKAPGRPVFDELVSLIEERKDIAGILCWRLNRLFRNPADEGKIRWLLQSGTINEIITPHKTYQEVDADFTMAVEGAQAQRFISDLKKDTARGVQSKITKGIAPMLAPPGYRNALEKRQGERDIIPHPIYFPLMKQIFELFLTGHYSVEALHKKVEELGIKNSRNQIVSATQLYKILKDPFYTGIRFIYAKRLHTNGIHEAMITDEQFDLIQEILAKRSRPRVIRFEGFLNGIMSCGECHMTITQEVHRKKYKNGNIQDFVYYRCTKKKKNNRCSQPYLPAHELDRQAMKYLQSVRLSPRFVEWAIKWLNVMHEQQKEIKNARLKATQQEYNETVSKITRTVDLMIAGIITPEDGRLRKQQLEIEKTRLFSILSKIDTHVTEWTNLTIQTFDFVTTAQYKFEHGTIEQKKTILKVIGSNLVVRDGKLHIEFRTPFAYIQSVVAKMNENQEIEANLPPLSPQEAFLGSSQDVVGG